MNNPNESFEGKKLRLDKDCIFVQLEKPGDTEARAVVLRHKPKPHLTYNHYTPQNDSARMVLDLLTKNAHKDKGTSFEDIVDQLVESFAVDRPQAIADLNAFLRELKGHELLEEKSPSDHVPPEPYPHHQGEARGRIVEGGTLISLGYTINWWRP